MKRLKQNTKVKVILASSNASDFSLKFKECGFKGVYEIEDWQHKVFTVKGDIENISFKHNPKIHCAYPLTLNNVLKGYVYNDAVKVVSKPTLLEQLMFFLNLKS